VSWTHWNLGENERSVERFMEQLAALRSAHPVLRRRTFLKGTHNGHQDVTWLRPEGGEMSEAEWHDPRRHTIGMLLDGTSMLEVDERGEPVSGDTLLVWINAATEDLSCVFPSAPDGQAWEPLVSTELRAAPTRRVASGDVWRLAARTAVVFRRMDD
jgi:isoamylase